MPAYAGGARLPLRRPGPLSRQSAVGHRGPPGRDCKSKALWLYDRLGDPTALYVIGKVTRRAKSSHAWVYWRYQSRWWILDPTNLSTPIAADTVSSGRYVPYYSFGKDGAYRHPATQLLLATTENLAAHTPVVASRTVKRDPAPAKRKRRR